MKPLCTLCLLYTTTKASLNYSKGMKWFQAKRRGLFFFLAFLSSVSN
jgi:hypothetical protein